MAVTDSAAPASFGTQPGRLPKSCSSRRFGDDIIVPHATHIRTHPPPSGWLMARIRSIKPEFWGDRKLARLVSRDARLLYVALWNQADEHGRVQGDPRFVKGHCLPYDDDLDEDAVDGLVGQLATAGRVIRYAVDGDPYLFLPKLANHQRLEPAKVASRLPQPPELSVNDPEIDPDADSSEPRADSSEPIVALHGACSREPVAGSRGQGAGTNRADKPAPNGTRIPDPFPISDDMRDWAVAEGFTPEQARSSTERFVDYWRGKPGKDGRKTDWPATWRNWLRRDRDTGKPTKPGTDDKIRNTLAMAARLGGTEPRGIGQ